MAERLKRLISFNAENDHPQVHANSKGKGLWVVQLHSENADERIEVELRNLQKIDLMHMLPLILEQFTEIVAETSPATNAGYHIYQRT